MARYILVMRPCKTFDQGVALVQGGMTNQMDAAAIEAQMAVSRFNSSIKQNPLSTLSFLSL